MTDAFPNLSNLQDADDESSLFDIDMLQAIPRADDYDQDTNEDYCQFMLNNDDPMDCTRHPSLFPDSGPFYPGEDAPGQPDSLLLKKIRVKVNATCPACGASGDIMLNCGGSTPQTVNSICKYKMYCQPHLGGCGHKSNMSRDPNEDGTYTYTEANFALEGEPKRCDGYKCGKCGKKKKGHVCTGIRKTVVSSVLKNANDLTSNAYNTVGLGDECDDENAAIRSHSALPLLATIANHVAPVVVPPLAPVVVPPLAPVVVPLPASVVVPPPAPVVVPPLAPVVVPPLAPVVVPPLAPVVVPPPALVVVPPPAPVIVPPPAPVIAPPVFAVDDAQPTLLSIANANLFTNSEARNGNVAISILKLSRYKVMGDGSCWVYAMLACAGLCESCNMKREMPPTPRDRGMDRFCRRLSHLWMYEHQNMLSNDDIANLNAIVDELPKHPMVDAHDMGSFGTDITIMGLAAYLDVSVVCWNKLTMSTSNTRQQVNIHLHDDNAPLEMKQELMTPGEIVALSQSDARVMHIEWNGSNHYTALVGPTPVPIYAEQMQMLKNTPPVTLENPRRFMPKTKKMEDVDGWIHLVNLWRSDMAHTPIPADLKRKPLKQLLAHARSKNYHGLMYSVTDTNATYFIKFTQNAKPTIEDFCKTGDFSCNLYIDKLWQNKATGIMPPDPMAALCPCRTTFMRKMHIIECTKCKTEFHKECVGVDEECEEWCCDECAD